MHDEEVSYKVLCACYFCDFYHLYLHLQFCFIQCVANNGCVWCYCSHNACNMCDAYCHRHSCARVFKRSTTYIKCFIRIHFHTPLSSGTFHSAWCINCLTIHIVTCCCCRPSEHCSAETFWCHKQIRYTCSRHQRFVTCFTISKFPALSSMVMFNGPHFYLSCFFLLEIACHQFTSFLDCIIWSLQLCTS